MNDFNTKALEILAYQFHESMYEDLKGQDKQTIDQSISALSQLHKENTTPLMVYKELDHIEEMIITYGKIPTNACLRRIMQLIKERENKLVERAYDEGYKNGLSSRRPISKGNKSYGAGA